jgi:hypothetical protein
MIHFLLLIISSICCHHIFNGIAEMYTDTRPTHDGRHMKEGSSWYNNKKSREVEEGSEGLKNRIKESSCRFLQLLASVDASLFSDCVRHSLLGSHLTANMAAYSAHDKELNKEYDKEYSKSSGRQPYSGGAVNGYEEGKGEGEGEGVGVMNEWGGKGGFASFSAQSDLLCVILRAETLSTSSAPSRDTEQEAQGFPSHTPQHSPLSFSKSVRILDPHIPLKLLSAVTSSLNAMASTLSQPLSQSSSTQSQKKVLSCSGVVIIMFCQLVKIFPDNAYSSLLVCPSSRPPFSFLILYFTLYLTIFDSLSSTVVFNLLFFVKLMQVSASSSTSPFNDLTSLSLPLTSSLRLLCVVISNRCWADALSVELGEYHLYFLCLPVYCPLSYYAVLHALPCLLYDVLC